MKTLIYCEDEGMLDGFKFGSAFRTPLCIYTQGVDENGYWLLMEDETQGDNQTYELCKWGGGLKHTDTGVET